LGCPSAELLREGLKLRFRRLSENINLFAKFFFVPEFSLYLGFKI